MSILNFFPLLVWMCTCMICLFFGNTASDEDSRAGAKIIVFGSTFWLLAGLVYSL